MVDFDEIVLKPNYEVHGVDAVLALEDDDTDSGTDTDTAQYDLRVIDKTAGAVITLGDGVTVESIGPVAAVRMVELAEKGLTPEAMRDGLITFNDETWRIRNHRLRPHGQGEAKGEAYLLLIEP